MIVNEDARVVRMMLQVVASPMIVILTTLEVSFMLLENIYSTVITRDARNIFILMDRIVSFPGMQAVPLLRQPRHLALPVGREPLLLLHDTPHSR